MGIVGQPLATGEIERQALLGARKTPHEGVQSRTRRGAVDGAAQEALVIEHAPDRVVRHGVKVEAPVKVEARTRHVEQRQEHEGAVLLEEVVVGPAGAQLPDVADEEVHLVRVERQLVFPDVPILEIAIGPHQLVVGQDRIVALVAAGQPAHGEEQAAIGTGRGAVAHRIGGEWGRVLLPRGINPQEGVTEHRGGVVEIGGGKDEGHRRRIEDREPGLERWANGLPLRPVSEWQALAEPAPARGPDAARIGTGPDTCPRPGEGGEGRVQLGRRIDRPRRRQKERRIVDQAPRRKGPQALVIVKKRQPLRSAGQARRARLRTQRLEVGGGGRRACERDDDSGHPQHASRHAHRRLRGSSDRPPDPPSGPSAQTRT